MRKIVGVSLTPEMVDALDHEIAKHNAATGGFGAAVTRASLVREAVVLHLRPGRSARPVQPVATPAAEEAQP